MVRAHAWLLVAAGLVAAGAIAMGPTGSTDESPVSVQSHDGPDHALTITVEAIACPPGFDNEHEDDVCLAYDGQVPGPTLVFEEHDTVRITLENRIPETVAGLDVDPELEAELSQAPASLHRHGVSGPASSDGIRAIPATQLEDSLALPGGSFTYTFTVPWRGSWHYHDHVMGPGGVHGQERGLFGTMVVLAPGQPAHEIYGLHMSNAGANGGLGLDVEHPAGEAFELAVSGLGDWWFTVTLDAPSGEEVGEVRIGPGVSRSFVVENPEPGAYAWRAFHPFLGEYTGEVVVS